MQIEQPDGKTLRFIESRKTSFVFVVVLAIFILVVEGFLLIALLVSAAPLSQFEEEPNKLVRIALLVKAAPLSQFVKEPEILVDHLNIIVAGALPFLLVPLILRCLLVAVFGRVITFDGRQRVVTKNRRLLARFDEVKHLDIRRREDSVTRLKIILNSGRKIRVGKLCSEKDHERVKAELEALLALPESRPPQDNAGKDISRALSLMFYISRGVGIAFFAGSLVASFVSATYLVKGVTTTGTIVEVKTRVEESSKTPDYGSRAIDERVRTTVADHFIAFEDRNGIRHTFVNTEAFIYEPGQKVTLVYMPDNPERVRLKWFGKMWGPSILLAVFGLIPYGISWFLKYLRLVKVF